MRAFSYAIVCVCASEHVRDLVNGATLGIMNIDLHVQRRDSNPPSSMTRDRAFEAVPNIRFQKARRVCQLVTVLGNKNARCFSVMPLD